MIRPCPSVKRPSSNICSSMFITSPFAFSNSSKSTTEYGRRLTFSVSCPPSSYPTYPGGAPTRREEEYFSWNSDMSSVIRDLASPYTRSASIFARWVLPTPVGPRKRKLPIGLFGSARNALLRLRALAIAFIAGSCPITTSPSEFSMPISFSAVVAFIFSTGTPLMELTVSATSSAVTDMVSSAWLDFHSASAASNSREAVFIASR